MDTLPRRRSHHGARSLTAPGTEPRLRRLVLVGAGRANLHLLRALTRPLVRGLELVLVTPDRVQYDPSMTSGLLRGAYLEDEARIDVAALAERAGARVVYAQADRFAPDAHVVHAGTERIAFDLCVIDEVGPSIDADRPGVAEHAIAVRPASGLVDARRALEARLVRGTQPLRCTVVGGGSTGVECAFALQRMLRARESGGVVTIVDGAPAILGDLAPCREQARRALEREGVCFALGAPVVAVRGDSVMLAYGGALPSDLVVWATGGAAPRLIVASGLPHDDRGRLLVDEGLRARTGAPIWAAGDCAATGGETRASRHEGDLLERELRAHLGSARRRVVAPRARPLCLLDTGDGRAILRWGRVTTRSRLAWWLKRRLDRRFVARLGEA
jgi:NADH dehydrogenase FAD-containing subunit